LDGIGLKWFGSVRDGSDGCNQCITPKQPSYYPYSSFYLNINLLIRSDLVNLIDMLLNSTNHKTHVKLVFNKE